ncbi:histidinol-phosphatase HisJ family protein [Candidatus Latescibacterota bacterium]
MPFPDYHMHTFLCKHADGDMEEYVLKAISIGLTEIGFSDHMPVMPEPQFCMGFGDLDYYVDTVLDLQDRFSDQITIKLGCEMDIVLDKQDEIKRIIETYPFDYVIGSIHYLDNWPFDQVQYSDTFENERVEGIYNRFFDMIIQAAETGLYDITGHIDNIKRMGYYPDCDLGEMYERVAVALRSMDCTVEINTSGFDTAAEEQYPSVEFLQVLQRHDVTVTIGSDAHRPEDVGRHYDSVKAILDMAGYTHVAHFSERKRTLEKL